MRSSKGVFPIALLRTLPIFPIEISGRECAPSVFISNPSASNGIAV